MKRLGRVLFCLAAAALFGYLMLYDYPAMLQSLSVAAAEEDAAAEEQVSGDVSTVAETQSVVEEDTEEELSETRAILFVGSISETAYDALYPAFEDLDCTGTLLFQGSHLTGDYAQLSTAQFQALVDEGWDYAIGCIEGDDELTTEEWSSRLSSDISEIRERSGVRPTVYCFANGEYDPERVEVLEEKDFTAFYCSEDDAEAASDDNAGLARAVYIPVEEDSDMTELLDEARSYDSAVFGQIADDDSDELETEQWTELIEALRNDGQFTLVSQHAWLGED